jgi:hypothetical protein
MPIGPRNCRLLSLIWAKLAGDAIASICKLGYHVLRFETGRHCTMHIVKYGVVLGLLCPIGFATAAELTGAEVESLISGNTVYLETTIASGTGTPGRGTIYYAANGSALYKTPMGVMWHATWFIKKNMACHDWKEVPNNPCTKYDKQGDTISLINSETGMIRAKIIKIAPGNAENLEP